MTDPALAIIGISHRTAGLDLREALAPPPDRLGERLALFDAAGLSEGLLLATCDRVELIGLGGAETMRAAFRALERAAGLGVDATLAARYHLTGPAALTHLCRVASALDSQIIGEPFVLGQLHDAHRAAIATGKAGPGLERFLAAAYHCAKRVRAETRIGEKPVGVAACALTLAREVHGEIAPLSAVLLGCGEMGEYLAGEFVAAGLGRMVVACRIEALARDSARRLGARAALLSALPELLPDTDLVISAIGAGRWSLEPDQLNTALRRRRRRPILLFDAAMPADLPPGLATVEGAYAYSLDDLERRALHGRSARDAALAPAEAIVAAECAEFLAAQAARAAVPALSVLRGQIEGLRRDLLTERPGLDAATATRLLVQRLLHRPSLALKALAASDPAAAQAAEALIVRLFGGAEYAIEPALPETPLDVSGVDREA